MNAFVSKTNYLPKSHTKNFPYGKKNRGKSILTPLTIYLDKSLRVFFLLLNLTLFSQPAYETSIFHLIFVTLRYLSHTFLFVKSYAHYWTEKKSWTKNSVKIFSYWMSTIFDTWIGMKLLTIFVESQFSSTLLTFSWKWFGITLVCIVRRRKQ